MTGYTNPTANGNGAVPEDDDDWSHRLISDDEAGIRIVECSTRPGDTFTTRYVNTGDPGEPGVCPFCGGGVYPLGAYLYKDGRYHTLAWRRRTRSMPSRS